ncbi:hypothetical protein MMC10_008278 [Thelotrema lepadinum]|nr:hypothetical protein [Thelotrema lepadinum]
MSHFAEGARELNERLDHSLYSHKLALIASLIFTFYELLSGSEMISLLHLRHGANIVAGLHHKPTSPLPELPQSSGSTVIDSPAPLRATSPDIDVDVSEITEAFARAVTEISCYGVRYLFNPLVEPSLPQEFSSLSGPYGARSHLNLIISYMHSSLDLRLESTRTLPSKQLGISLESRFTVVKDLLSRWKDLYIDFQNWVTKMAEQEAIISGILEMQHQLANLKLSTHFFEDESIYDSYSSEFQGIVSHCEAVLTSGPNSWKDRFSADSAVVHPLYFVAIKCRVGPLRRRALTLLGHAGREGAHDGRKLATVARWVMEREEADAAELGACSSPASVGTLSTTTPDVRARIRGVVLHFDQGGEFVRILCSRKTEGGEWMYYGGMARYDGVQESIDEKRALELASQVERYTTWHGTIR